MTVVYLSIYLYHFFLFGGSFQHTSSGHVCYIYTKTFFSLVVVNVFLIWVSTCSLLIYRNATDFHVYFTACVIQLLVLEMIAFQ